MLTMAVPEVEILAVCLFMTCFFVIYLPDDSNIYGSRDGKFDGIGLM